MEKSETAAALRAPTARELAAAIGRHLPGWSIEEKGDEETGRWMAVLAREDGAAIVLRLATWGRAQLEIHGRAPKYPDGRTFVGRVTKIGCNPSRSPASLAKDIAQRLLPAYLAEYERGVRYIDERVREEAEALLLARRLAAFLGEEPRAMKDSRVSVHLGECTSPAYGHIEIMAAGEPHISMRLSRLSVAQAERIAAALGDAGALASGPGRVTAEDSCAKGSASY
jgi:hypothetical protein